MQMTMAFCTKCGANAGNSPFCPQCGAPVPQPQSNPQSVYDAGDAAAKTKKKIRLISILGGAVLVALALVLALVVFKKDDMVGTYRFVRAEGGCWEEDSYKAHAKMLNEVNTTLTLNSNGTGTFRICVGNYEEYSSPVTWDKDGKTLTMEGQLYHYTFSNGLLELQDGNEKMTFMK